MLREIIEAASNGDLERLQSLVVKYGTKNINNLGDFNWSALTFAISNGHFEIVQYLLEECKANSDSNSFVLAASLGNLEIVEYLIKEEFIKNVNIKNKDGVSALQLAISEGHLDVVKCLVEQGGASINQNIIFQAASNGQIDIVEYLISSYATEEPKEQLSNLILEANKGSMALGQYLINEYHAKPNKIFVSAAKCGYLDLMNYLKETYNLDIDKNVLEKAFMSAALVGNLESVKYLKDNYDIDINVKDTENTSALMHAAQGGKISRDVFWYLIVQGADVDAKNSKGETAKTLARDFNFMDNIQLSEYQKNKNIENHSVKTEITHTTQESFRSNSCEHSVSNLSSLSSEALDHDDESNLTK